MWYCKLLFPIFYIYQFLNFFFYIKHNFLKTPLHHNIINKIIMNLTIVKLNSNYNYIITIFLNFLINFCEILPISIFFIFKYRQKHYVEICNMKFIINSYKYKILYKQISEIFIFLIKKIKKFNLNAFILNIFYNFRYISYYNKFDLILNKNLFCNNQILLHRNYYFVTLNMCNILKKLNFLFINNLKTNFY